MAAVRGMKNRYGLVAVSGIATGILLWAANGLYDDWALDAAFSSAEKSLWLTIVLEPGFEGDLKVVEDVEWPVDYRKGCEIVQEDGTLRVPKGVLGSVPYRIHEIRDKNGTWVFIDPDGDGPAPGMFGKTGEYTLAAEDEAEPVTYWVFGIKEHPEDENSSAEDQGA